MDEAAKIETLKEDERAQWLRDFEAIAGNDTVPPLERGLKMDRARMIYDIRREYENRLQDAAIFLEYSLQNVEKWYHEEMSKKKCLNKENGHG